jgi:hypothetical protein
MVCSVADRVAVDDASARKYPTGAIATHQATAMMKLGDWTFRFWLATSLEAGFSSPI